MAQVYTFTDANGEIRLMAEINPAPGGSQPGVAIVRGPFAFAFNTPNIATGAPIGYTPTVGDILLDAWFESDTPWGGTTPPYKADFGTFVGANYGLFAAVFDAIDLSQQSQDSEFPPGFLNNVSATSPGTLLSFAPVAAIASNYSRVVPAKMTAADPLKVVVSVDGTNNGGSVGAGVGAARLYIVTATPVAF